MPETRQTRHDSIRTEHASVDWAKRFMLFHQKRHPTLLTHVAPDRKVAASTQNQALSALLFLDQKVLHADLQTQASPLYSVRSSPTDTPFSEAFSLNPLGENVAWVILMER